MSFFLQKFLNYHNLLLHLQFLYDNIQFYTIKGEVVMHSSRTDIYAERLSALIRSETVSTRIQPDKTKFYTFQELLRQMFPALCSAAEWEDFDGSFLLRWKGQQKTDPILLMNHHDVVEATGQWKYPPFSGTIAEGKLWGRGTLDTKGGLWAMLQAAEELAEFGYVPKRDVYFFSACTEETGGTGADTVSQVLQQRGIRFSMVLDEGGMILEAPMAGAKGAFAMVGLGEKGCADLKFIARSSGGHASTPGKNTPLVRLGKFMAAVEKADLFEADISPVICEMLKRISSTMDQPLKFILGHAKALKPVLLKVIPAVSSTAGAMLKTTLAFTMAKGSEGFNVLPQEAWVIGNMRYSHHQGGPSSFEEVRKLAETYDIEMEVLDPGFSSPLSDCNTEAFRLVEQAVSKVFPGVITTPYLMTGASDCRYMSRVSDNCLRFAPFRITQAQMDSIHGLNENVDLSALVPAVDFYKHIITEA